MALYLKLGMIGTLRTHCMNADVQAWLKEADELKGESIEHGYTVIGDGDTDTVELSDKDYKALPKRGVEVFELSAMRLWSEVIECGVLDVDILLIEQDVWFETFS